jgi:hypothetical protein
MAKVKGTRGDEYMITLGVPTDGTSYIQYVGDVDLFKFTKQVWVSRTSKFVSTPYW